jgi:hypothetical protein
MLISRALKTQCLATRARTQLQNGRFHIFSLYSLEGSGKTGNN